MPSKASKTPKASKTLKSSNSSNSSKSSKTPKSADAPCASAPCARQPSKPSKPSKPSNLSKRKSPAFDATDFAGRRKKGGDGNWYKSVETKTGGYRWAIVKATVKPVKPKKLDSITPTLKKAKSPKNSKKRALESDSDADSDADSDSGSDLEESESESEVQVKRIKLSTLAGKVAKK